MYLILPTLMIAYWPVTLLIFVLNILYDSYKEYLVIQEEIRVEELRKSVGVYYKD
jgi:hypothetical protein